ncbi:hypothetical protein ABID82_005077 [Methylobacterium sp. PvP062]|uniref:Uncharacterized protein n=1 Tax=Methylobacterium radiotolerans TaxID=31998 RepID=A0ABV2NU29_9HYPH|nr:MULTISPECIES: hypothetical protein [unclassified Methylobacterium]MBP2498391.1 hypothetical protein [Methylobacterium sp. PvP105]MBP2505775.1 hypothetical protein [Methylobacterium sp. PvP109]
MPLIVSYPSERGNTVPYPPLFDDVRRNHGFTDLRGKPEQINRIPEALESQGLREILAMLASEASQLMSVGCDLGSHKRGGERLSRRHWAGGYIQIAQLPLAPPNRAGLFAIAKTAESKLRAQAGQDTWKVAFALCPTHFKFQELLETETLWIWFDAAASGHEKALLARERLLSTLKEGLTISDKQSSDC